ncbi:MAG: hypothetical protein ACI4OA_09165 [Selenomonadaceae bacterium]
MIRKMMRSLCLMVTAIFMVELVAVSGAMAATPETMQDKLVAVEKAAYGEAQTGALLDRVSRLEKDFTKSQPNESVMKRVDDIYEKMFMNDLGPSLITQMNAIEYGLTQEVSMKSIQERVNDMEMTLAGKTSEGPYIKRIETLAGYAFGSSTMPLEAVTIPANTLVKVSTVTPINAKNLKKGDQIEYQAAEDAIENGLLLFAKGAPGYGTVQKVTQARNFGRDAEVEIDFESLRAIDGTDASMLLGEESKKKMESMAMAAGASLAGMLVLGPIGVIGGAFIHGKNIDLPAGTELYIQTSEDVTLYGLRVESGAAE